MKQKVFVPQIPSRYDSGMGGWVPTVNMDPAKTFGDIVEMLPPEASRMDIATLLPAIKLKLADFSSGDWIVAAGDPTITATAVALVVKNGFPLKMLKWDRNLKQYIPVEVDL